MNSANYSPPNPTNYCGVDMADNHVTKICTKCNVEHDINNFPNQKGKRDGKSSHCKPCTLIRLKLWAEKNKEYVRKKVEEYTDKNRDNIQKYWREYHQKHKEIRNKIRAETQKNNRDSANKKNREWKKRNKDYACFDEGKRRATKIKATPKWASEEKIKEIYLLANKESKHVDHIVPLRSKIVCGLHCEHNLQLLTPKENLLKNNRYWPDMP